MTTLADDGDVFTVLVSNGVPPDVLSDPATLTVLPFTAPPVITSHPADQAVTEGDPVTFSVAATGTPPPS